MIRLFFIEFSADKIIDKKSTANDVWTFMDMQFHQNGGELWLMSKNSYITVIDAQQWFVKKSVSSDERYHIKMSPFVSTTLAQEIIRESFNSLWIGMTNTKKLVFMSGSNGDNVIDMKPFLPWKCTAVKRFALSPDNKLLALISTDGTLKLYSIEFMLRQIFQTV